MKIILNGHAIELEQACTLKQLIDNQGLAGKRLAAEVNREIIPRTQHEACQLKEGDQIEIVHAIGGG